MTEIDAFALSPYLFLFLSVFLSFLGSRPQFISISLGISLVLAFFSQTLTGWSPLVFLALPLALFVWVNHYFADLLRKFGFVVFLGLGWILATHSIPGVNNHKVFDQLVFAEGMASFDMFFNYDKVFLAVVMLMMLPKLDRQLSFKGSYGLIFKYFAVSVLILFPIAYFTGYVKFQMNTNPYVLLWAVNNLFFVCFSEEIIFRRFIQNNLVDYFRNTQYGDLVSVFLTALLFGLAHFAGGWLYVGLATLAGVLYGFCFYHSCNVRSSIALHFLVNLSHALFFTYPFAV